MSKYGNTYQTGMSIIHLSPETIGSDGGYSYTIPADEHGSPDWTKQVKNIIDKLGNRIPEAEYKFSDGAYLAGHSPMKCSKYYLTEMETCNDVTVECWNIYVSEDFDKSKSNCNFIGKVIAYTDEVKFNDMYLDD